MCIALLCFLYGMCFNSSLHLPGFDFHYNEAWNTCFTCVRPYVYRLLYEQGRNLSPYTASNFITEAYGIFEKA